MRRKIGLNFLIPDMMFFYIAWWRQQIKSFTQRARTITFMQICPIKKIENLLNNSPLTHALEQKHYRSLK